ncbi:MAG: hypothetical protein WCR51_09555 [Planctomycetia bacterium]
MPRRSTPDSRRMPIPQAHEILGLSPREDDAVKVIEIAQVLLRRWRRVPMAAEEAGFPHRAGQARNRIRKIVAARQAILESINARWRDE